MSFSYINYKEVLSVSRLSKDETIFIKEHLESLTVREFPTKAGLTDIEIDLT